MFPFDWTTPFGYFFAWFAQFGAGTAVYVGVIPVLSLIFASCWLFVTIADDLTQKFAVLNNNVKKLARKDHAEMKRHFCHIIQFYSDGNE